MASTIRDRIWDWVLALPIALGLLAARRARRRGTHRMPVVRRVYDRIGVYPVLDQYYEPMVIPDRHLRRPLDQPRSLPGLRLDVAAQLDLLASFDRADELLVIPFDEPVGGGPWYDNGNFVQGDAEALYCMVRHLRPRRMIEVGSGMSTLFAQRAIAANEADDPARGCRLTCVEPYEMPWLEQYVDDVVRARVEEVGTELFAELGDGDILFVDTSHVVRPQGDVLHLFLEVIPSLAPGVLVHVHDVFTPRDYPDEWIRERRLLWNEQYLLEALLTDAASFEVVLALNHLWHEHPDEVGAAFPVLAEHGGMPGSFWLRRR